MAYYNKSGIEQIEDKLLATPAGPEHDRLRKVLESRKAAYAESEKIYGACPPRPSPPPSDPNQHRILILKEMEKTNMDPKDLANLQAVIVAYETGKLDLNERADHFDCALFWGGVLKRNWASLDADDTFEKDPPKWQKENPNGRVWVEDGLLGHHKQNVQGQVFSLPPSSHQQFYHYFYVLIVPPDRQFEVFVQILRDTGATVGTLYRNDINDLNVPNDFAHWGPYLDVGTANGVVRRRVIWLMCRVWNHETQAPVEDLWYWANFVVDYDLNFGSPGIDRLSSPRLLRPFFEARGPNQEDIVIAQNKTRMNERVVARP